MLSQFYRFYLNLNFDFGFASFELGIYSVIELSPNPFADDHEAKQEQEFP